MTVGRVDFQNFSATQQILLEFMRLHLTFSSCVHKAQMTPTEHKFKYYLLTQPLYFSIYLL